MQRSSSLRLRTQLYIVIWLVLISSVIVVTVAFSEHPTTSLANWRQHDLPSWQPQQEFHPTFTAIGITKRSSRSNILLQQHRARTISTNTILFLSPSPDHELPINSNNNDDNNQQQQQPRLYPQRWIQLLYLSLLALLSDWICFSVAAVPDTFLNNYPTHTAASLIDLFLFTNVLACFTVTDIVARIGLQRAIQGSAILMTMGCWFRSGFDFLPFVGSPDTNSLVSYPLVVVGTVLVGMAQPFFQCTPPLLSATWFAPSERATSTAVALNFNQIGIATAFLVGGAMAEDKSGLSNYMGLIAVLCTTVTLGTMLQFQNEPPVPPSMSEITKKNRGATEPPFLTSVQQLFQISGFKQALAAFICSITITNIVGAFIDDIMERGGITEQFSIDMAGAGFEFAILLGGILIGKYVDRTKQYKNVTLACLAATALTVIPLGLTEHQLGKEPILLLFALLVRAFENCHIQQGIVALVA
jgi:Major Facilitator Superfamily